MACRKANTTSCWKKELPQLCQGCHDVYPLEDSAKGLPNFTIVICAKRHHTRFYPTQEDGTDRLNTKPGTVADRGVTEARNLDFYLQAHSALQGTARPAHYFVLVDEIFTKYVEPDTLPPEMISAADVLKDLTLGMSYNFGRATKAISICTPARYADMLCDRARCYIAHAFETPTQSLRGSSVSGSAVPGGPVEEDDVAIHPNLRESMFYV